MRFVRLVHRSLLLPVLCFVAFAAGAQEPRTSLFAPLSDGNTVELPPLDPGPTSPAASLGYLLGERFTSHDEILRYLRELAGSSPRVALHTYGETYEGRPLVVLAISAEENIDRLENLREEREVLLRGDAESSPESLPLVVWLGYGVHGNESSSAEAAMAVAYVLAAGGGEIPEMLRSTVVLVDPLLNPDGRERYVHDYVVRRGREPDPDPAAAEHVETWPGGRGNHYYLDLNRDWAWLTQQESRARVAEMRRWDPQVVVDLHEMSPESTYFFPPSAEPVHPSVATRARPWLERFGRANAAAFDRQGWLFFVGEQYDLFYPAYGDSYPTLRGGVGMTYEMAGGGRAGQALRLSDGDLLTLADRVARHYTTSIATVRTAAASSPELLRDTVAARRDARTAEPRLFLWNPGEPEGRALAALLTSHGIEVQETTRELSLATEAVAGNGPERRSYPAGTIAVSTAQPLGTLVRTLLEADAPMPSAFLEEQRARVEANRPAEFYDITAWSLPLAYNVPVTFTEQRVSALRPVATALPPVSPELGSADVGLLAPPAGLVTYRFAAALQRAGIRYRMALEDLRLGERSFPAGTLFVPRRGQDEALERAVSIARDLGQEIAPARSSFTAGGISLGSGSMLRIRPSRIALVRGPGLDPTSFGSLWHLLDRDVEVDLTVLDTSVLDTLRLGRFDALILPDGDAYETLGEDWRDRLESWVRDGGTLIAIGDGAEWVAEGDENGSPTAGEQEAANEAATPRPVTYSIPGAIVATNLRTHPLTVAVPSPPPVLFWGDRFLEPTGDPRRDLMTVRGERPILAGFAWPEGAERLPGALLLSHERVGAGQVVLFAQDPVFRLFWRGTMPLLLNAALHGPSMAPGGAY